MSDMEKLPGFDLSAKARILKRNVPFIIYLEMVGKTLFINFMCDGMFSLWYQSEVSPLN